MKSVLLSRNHRQEFYEPASEHDGWTRHQGRPVRFTDNILDVYVWLYAGVAFGSFFHMGNSSCPSNTSVDRKYLKSEKIECKEYWALLEWLQQAILTLRVQSRTKQELCAMFAKNWTVSLKTLYFWLSFERRQKQNLNNIKFFNQWINIYISNNLRNIIFRTWFRNNVVFFRVLSKPIRLAFESWWCKKQDILW